jgi:hypothetical protein
MVIVLSTIAALCTMPVRPVVAAAVPAVSLGSCGSVLLSGSAWLGGVGVDVMSNGADQGLGVSCGGTNHVNGIVSGSEWQCTELVNRLYLTRGWISATWPGNGGRSSPSARDSMYDEAPASLSKQANGSISYLAAGDAVSINVYDDGVFQQDGHVLVVNSVSGASVSLVSQNGGVVTSTASLSNGTLTIPASGSWTYSVIGVVHSPGSANGARSIATSDGHIQVFRVDNGAVQENWYSPATGHTGNWVSPVGMQGGAGAVGTPAVVKRSGQQVIDVFVRSTDGVIRETWYNWGSGHWGGWIGIGGATFTGDPAVVGTSDGHDQIFATSGGAVRQNWFDPVTGHIGNWVSPVGMQGGAGAVGTPAVVKRSGQQVIDVFVRSTDGVIRETWYNWGSGHWGGWIGIGGATFTGDPRANATSDGHDQIFAVSGGTVKQNWFDPATGHIGDWITI